MNLRPVIKRLFVFARILVSFKNSCFLYTIWKFINTPTWVNDPKSWRQTGRWVVYYNWMKFFMKKHSIFLQLCIQLISLLLSPHYTEVRFASFLSGGFTTMTIINQPERKLAKRTSVQCGASGTSRSQNY